MTFGVCLLFLVPWLMPNKTEQSREENSMLLNEREQLKKRTTNCRKTSRTIFSYPTEAAFFASEKRSDLVLQRSVSMEMLSQIGTPPLMKSAMYRAWSAAAQLHCTDSLNGSSGYETDSNRQSSSSQSASEIIDKPIENELDPVTIVTPAMSFDDLEVAVQNEKLVRQGWVAGSVDIFSLLFESLLEDRAASQRTSVIETGGHGNDLTINGYTNTTPSDQRRSQEEMLYNLEFCRETII